MTSHDTQNKMSLRQILLVGVALVAAMGGSLFYKEVIRPFLFVDTCLDSGWNWDHKNSTCSFVLKKRPGLNDVLMFDFASLLSHQGEGIDRYLKGLRQHYGIESLIVTLPTLKRTGLPEGSQQAAFQLFNNWDVGRAYNGRGVLVLLVNDTQDVKIEVGMALEDIFTDLFTGYAETKQLRNHMQTGTVGHGLVAVLEEFERRADIKSKKQEIKDTIERMDHKLLSMGAGAIHNTSEYAGQNKVSQSQFARGAQSPEEAWKILISKFRGEDKYDDVDILTDATKLITGDQNNLDYSWIDEYAHNDFEAIVDGRYAVISFGLKEGWDHDPVFFLWSDNPRGWKNDMVSMRKYNVRGRAPHWMIERADHPYINATSYAYWSMKKDIPSDPNDIYTAERDGPWAARFRTLKASNKNDFETQMELGRLGVSMALLPQDIHPHLAAAERLNPSSPLPHKYRAVVGIESNFQYKTALKEINAYLEKGGDPIYAYNFLGFLYSCQGKDEDARDFFLKAIDLYRQKEQTPSVYTLDKLIRANIDLYQKENRSDQKRKMDYQAAHVFYKKMKEIYPDHYRTRWLQNKLHHLGIRF